MRPKKQQNVNFLLFIFFKLFFKFVTIYIISGKNEVDLSKKRKKSITSCRQNVQHFYIYLLKTMRLHFLYILFIQDGHEFMLSILYGKHGYLLYYYFCVLSVISMTQYVRNRHGYYTFVELLRGYLNGHHTCPMSEFVPHLVIFYVHICLGSYQVHLSLDAINGQSKTNHTTIMEYHVIL